MGEQIIINLLDYSCNAPTSYISKKQTPKYAITEDDIEMGNTNQKYGGKKKTKRQRKKKRRTIKRKKKTRKSH